MKKNTDFLSPISNFVFHLNVYICAYVFFHPSWKDILTVFVVDSIAAIIAFLLETKIFLKKNPTYSAIFPKDNLEVIKSLKGVELKKFIYALFDFPLIRAKHLIFANLLKVQPAIFTIAFFWQSDNHIHHFFKLMAIEIIFFSFVFSTSYVEFHDYISKKIRILHKKYDWSSVFNSDLKQNETRINTFKNVEFISLIGVVFGVLFVQVVAAIANSISSIEMILVSVAGLALICRNIYVTRKYFLDGFELILGHIEKFHIETSPIPFHSSFILAKFENTLNSLYKKIKIHEDNLTVRTIKEVENSNLINLGQIAALIVHDLSGPLHSLSFCINELLEGREDQQKYLNRMKLSSDKAVDLVESIKYTIRNDGEPFSSLWECHCNVEKVLSIEIPTNSPIAQIRFDDSLKDVIVKMPRIYLNHVLYNIYKNALNNFYENKIQSPVISITRDNNSIIISDNGSGLSPDEFKILTDYKLTTQNHSQQRGLGLRLVRRILENFNIKLGVLNGPIHNFKTSFTLSGNILFQNAEMNLKNKNSVQGTKKKERFYELQI